MKQKKIYCYTKYTSIGASSRLRTYQFIDFLESNGYQVIAKPLYDQPYLEHLYKFKTRNYIKIFSLYFKRFIHLVSSSNVDLIWIEKELFPYLPSFMEKIILLRKTPYIVDFDDAIPWNYKKSNNIIVNCLLRNKLHSFLQNASMVIVGNKYLENLCKESGAKNIKIIPTVVDTSMYIVKDKDMMPTINIGWIGTPNTAKYLDIVTPTLEKVTEIHKIKLIIIGDMNYKPSGIYVENIPWTEETEIESLNKIDIGIMPLLDEPWERGKCGYKLIQYMALEKPVVASPVGVNIDIVTPEVGFLASSSADWLHALNKLISDSSLRQSMGRAGKRLVDKNYSKSITQNHLKTIIDRALRNNE